MTSVNRRNLVRGEIGVRDSIVIDLSKSYVTTRSLLERSTRTASRMLSNSDSRLRAATDGMRKCSAVLGAIVDALVF